MGACCGIQPDPRQQALLDEEAGANTAKLGQSTRKEPSTPSVPSGPTDDPESKTKPQTATKQQPKPQNKTSKPAKKQESSSKSDTLKVLTWNIAGINNNPWEYYITLKDENYNKLMSEIESYLTNTGKEIKVRFVLEEIDKEFLNKLENLLSNDNLKCDNFQEIIKNDVDKYLDENVVEFLSNKFIGSSRLISWPDRLLNTIDNEDEDKKDGDSEYIYRPTVINYYPDKFKDCANWFDLWCTFMKETGNKILLDNIDNKYAKKYEEHGDHNRFLHLNIVLLAIFDAILVYLLFDIQKKQNIDWQSIKTEIYNVLNKNKVEKTVEIINDKYSDCDVLFLQEVRNNFNKELLPNYLVVFPEKLSKNNQTSIVCLNKKTFKDVDEKVNDITGKFFEAYEGKMGINPGDLCVIEVNKYILVSFHGDTGGMATPDLIKTINDIQQKEYKDYKLLIGIDANTYYDNYADGNKFYSYLELIKLIKELNINTCYNLDNLPLSHTTNCPRTYLQPQLNKAVKQEDIISDKTAFRHPKDFILYYDKQFKATLKNTIIDNTGNKTYDDNKKYVIPSQDFPSDHAILSACLQPL